MLRPLRYITPYFLYVLAFLAFTKTGFYSWVPLQIGTLYLFLTSLGASLTFLDTAGRAVAMGLLCGTFGINAAHELGHRVNKFEQFWPKSYYSLASTCIFLLSITKDITNTWRRRRIRVRPFISSISMRFGFRPL